MTTTATEPAEAAFRRALRSLATPVDAAGLGAFRVAFGALLAFSVVRFVARGWVGELLLAPASHFTYLGFEWVRPWPAWAMYAHFAAMGLFALALMLGVRTRIAAALLCALFTYAELIEKASYLNHYYLVSLLLFLLSVVPSDGAYSLDVRRGRVWPPTAPRWAYWLLRAQVAVVYFYAGAAKLNSDWLLRAEPLATWLSPHADVPLAGPLLAAPWFAFVLSWAGALYDLTIVPLLLWRRTRAIAFVAVIGFHLTTWLLFPIGVFPWLMMITATLFFTPSWPRALLARAGESTAAARLAPSAANAPLSRFGALLLASYVALQVVLPLRFMLYPGAVNWTEQGFRFAWRVMLIEKTGQVDFEVVTSDGRYRVYPRAELTPLQYKMMSTQPDMIHEHALRLAERFRAQGARNVRVRANAWASLNGRPSQRLIDPNVDLAAVPRSLRAQSFIVPLLEDEPLRAARF